MALRAFCLLAFILGTVAHAAPADAAKVYTILVADKKSPAYANAKKMANDETIFAERKIHKALSKFEEIAKACPICPQPRVYNMPEPKCDIDPKTFCDVHIKVAGGEYAGKGGRGGFTIPGITATETALFMLGGYDDNFKTRNPFEYGTKVPNIAMRAKNHALREVYISGFFFDSQIKGHITLGYLKTHKLTIADNVFMNGKLGGTSPLIRARTPNAEVILRNNFYINNIEAVVADAAGWQNSVKLYTIKGNSFIGNLPYNPDPTSGTTAALFIKESGRAKKVLIEENIFAFNAGGAINPLGNSDKGPIEINNNLFFNNGDLFAETDPDGAAIVVKWGTFKDPKKYPWNVISLEYIEDDYEWKNDGNEAFDPELPIEIKTGGYVSSYDVKAVDSKANTVRRILKQNVQGTALKYEGGGPMKGDPKNMPFPANKKAQKYGVNPKRVEQF